MTREEAIEVYNGLINTKIKEAFEFFAPELAESEDERMIKAIVDALLSHCNSINLLSLRGYQIEDVKAWLEKQKEQKPAEKEITLTDFEKVLNTFLFDFANSTVEDCEPKDYIKKHSAEILKSAYKELNTQLQQDLFEAKQEGRREGYEVAKEELKPAEWSKGDVRNLYNVIYAVRVAYKDNKEYKKGLTDWLKSLRPQSKDDCGKTMINGEPISSENKAVDIPCTEWSEEEMSDKTLDEAAIDHANGFAKDGISHELYKMTFIAGAEWQREQDQPITGNSLEKEWLRYVNKAKKEYGGELPSLGDYGWLQIARHFAEWQKEQMMKDAVEGEICGRVYDHINVRFADGVCKYLEPKNISHIPADVSKYNIGDKVRIIIVKEEESK